MDFFKITENYVKSRNAIIVRPEFIVNDTKDLLTKGGTFYAIWDEETGLWSTNEFDVRRLVDKELDEYVKDLESKQGNYIDKIESAPMSIYGSGTWTKFLKYMRERPDSKIVLNERIIFANTDVKKNDYSSKRLSYNLEEGPIDAYDEMMSVLYSPEERQKLEWAIGAIISGDAKSIQKFIVLYGEAGTGKSTVLEIIQMLFEGYYKVFDAKSLTSNNNSFATEQLKDNPLVLIQHDGDLSRIEDNTRLNSIVSHEVIQINAKFEKLYSLKSHAFLFMGTNKPVKITDAKSGLLRRLIDVSPTGNTLPERKYINLFGKIKFELSGIAWHCLQVYNELGKSYYTGYRPLSMQEQTDYFFNFVEDNYLYFKDQDEVSLTTAYTMYKQYCVDSNEQFVISKMKFREEFKNYWKEYKDMARNSEGQTVRCLYKGFKVDKFDKYINKYGDQESNKNIEETIVSSSETSWLKFITPEDIDLKNNVFNKLYSDCIAQYANKNDIPSKKWEKVTTKLNELDTTKTHYIKIPENLIVIDFDIKNSDGNKDYEKNLEAASKWPKTYAELSKSGSGIHLHYIYDGDVNELSRVFDDNIEVKVYLGNAALRRKLTKFNEIEIAHIKPGSLPLRERKDMISFEGIKNEKSIRTLIKNNLNKEYHAGTKPSIDFIDKILNDAYESGAHYDVTDLRPAILYFASKSTNHAPYCISKVNLMHFKSDDVGEYMEAEKDTIIFYDVEIFPNLFVLVWKPDDAEKTCIKWINPSPSQIEDLIKYNLVGFNNRRYDNHILYARLMGYNNEQLYTLSKRIVNGSKNALFGEAYNLSYTDVYDFASAAHKQSLKKFEIELNIHHQELGLDWDQPVPEDMWETVADYCINDVVATEATFHYLSADWTARKILAELSGLSYNDTTNAHSTKIIFGDNKHPQDEFVYTDLSEMFPGYKFDSGKSTYRGEVVGEGGYVYAEPGMHSNVALLDVASMHPSSIENLNLFGPKYTKKFSDIKQVRVHIKHKEFAEAAKLFDGKLAPYLTDEKMAKDLSNALKTVINSVYGLTSASFDNPFRDPRNIDNIVAKRGALFMINLKHEVQKRGFTVAHIKTDSIKIPNATPEIIDFVMNYGKQYGYTFEHEATYARMCLVNNAVYIARYKDPKSCEGLYGYIPGDNWKAYNDPEEITKNGWTATGAQFAIPYTFKTLFSHEEIIFRDMCEVKAVTSAIYLDMNESLPDGEHDYKFIGKTGLFCPIQAGKNGGLLVRKNNDKYDAVVGTKGYRWLESETVEATNREKDIDKLYYSDLVNKAVDEISKYGDFDWLVDDTDPELLEPKDLAPILDDNDDLPFE